MGACDWQWWCRGDPDIEVAGDRLTVSLARSRKQRIEVADRDDVLELTAVVARPAVVQSIPDAHLRAWARNRTLQLVGFRVDRRGRLVGEAWLPKAGLGADEFLHQVRRVAEECDRFEYLLTGRDVE